jgi:hypothetical protein
MVFYRLLLNTEKSANLHNFRVIAKIGTFDELLKNTICRDRKGEAIAASAFLE